MHGTTERELALLARTFLEVFPDGRVVLLRPDEAALVATLGEGADPDARAARAAEPRVREHLDGVGVAIPTRSPRAAARGCAARSARGRS